VLRVPAYSHSPLFAWALETRRKRRQFPLFPLVPLFSNDTHARDPLAGAILHQRRQYPGMNGKSPGFEREQRALRELNF
jgi:hypothetical protein